MTDHLKPHIRLWDAKMHLIYSNKTDPRTPEQFMRDEMLTEAHYSKDWPPEEDWRSRDSGRLLLSHDGKRFIWSSAKEFLRHITAANNAIFDDPGRFGADLPPIKEGSKVGFTVGDKTIIGVVKRVYEEYGCQHIEFAETDSFSRALVAHDKMNDTIRKLTEPSPQEEDK